MKGTLWRISAQFCFCVSVLVKVTVVPWINTRGIGWYLNGAWGKNKTNTKTKIETKQNWTKTKQNKAKTKKNKQKHIPESEKTKQKQKQKQKQNINKTKQNKKKKKKKKTLNKAKQKVIGLKEMKTPYTADKPKQGLVWNKEYAI